LLRITNVQPVASDNPFVNFPDARDVILEVDALPTATMRLAWPHESSLLFGLIPLEMFWRLVFERPTPSLGFQLWFLEDQILNGPFCWVAVMVSVIVTSFFIPNMMQKAASICCWSSRSRAWACWFTSTSAGCCSSS
jgi:hypothetical protein